MTTDGFQRPTGNECHCRTRVGYDEVRFRIDSTSWTSHLHCTWFVRSIAILARKSGQRYIDSGGTERTLNSSESLDNLDSICELISTHVTAVAFDDWYLSELSGRQRVVPNQNKEWREIPSAVFR